MGNPFLDFFKILAKTIKKIIRDVIVKDFIRKYFQK